MKIDLVKRAGAVVGLALLAACGNAVAVSPSGNAMTGYVGKTLFVNGRPVTAARLNPAPLYGRLVPDAKSGAHYDYIINDYGSYASIFNYPKSTKETGEIAGAGGQGCTNALDGYGKNIIWNVAGSKQIDEYQVPNKLLKTLSVKYSFPSSCAMDTSGDLAVGILYASGTGGGDVVVFKKASGKPTVYTTALDEEFFDGYDNNGDLFA